VHIERRATDVLPDAIRLFLNAESAAVREESWSRFLGDHSRLLLRVARTVAPNAEDAMDAYAAILEDLRADDARRLRAYTPDGRSKFTTWLLVVARRICVDFIRRRYGRYGAEQDERDAVARRSRRALAALLSGTTDLATIPDERVGEPDEHLRTRELLEKLNHALQEISPDDRLLLKLRFDDELPAREIARLLALPTPFHVYRRLNAVLARLRDRLAERGVVSAKP
jgi:RNA polymerase sigma factor (sigma-70 family)